jgi:nitrite reductase/ring-hydroxylating ferredoxin subunit
VTDPDLTRRRALGIAIGGLSLPLLAACGGGSGAPASQSPAGPGGTKSTKAGGAGGATVLTPASQVPVGGGVILSSANVVVTQPSKGTFAGFSATCTHQGCLLASVASGTINCGCHGSQFSVKDGSNVAGPNGTPAGSVPGLPRVNVKMKGSDIVEV